MNPVPPRTGWRSFVLGRHAPVVALALAALVGAPSLAGGLFMDDYIHQLVLDGYPGFPGGVWGLFTFADGDPAALQPLIDAGPYPWWSWPWMRFSFLRPLTCALAQGEHALFGRFLPAYHLHSLLWFLGLVAVAGLLLRRALGPASAVAATGLASVLFALDDSHLVPVAWIANRNALVATVPVLLGLLAHVRWREDGFRAGLPLSLLGYAVGLAGGEAAVGALAYLAAYELFAGPGTRSRRALSLVPALLLGVGYVAVYRLAGAGAAGSGIYFDPLVSPGAFLQAAPGRALALVGGQLLGLPADAWILLPRLRWLLVAGGVLGLGLVSWLARSAWPALAPQQRKGLSWLAAGAALSLLPVLATFPFNRLLLMPSLGASAVVAVCLLHGLPLRGGRRVAAGLLAVANVVVPPLGWVGSYAVAARATNEQLSSALDTPLTDQQLAGRVVFFAAPDAASGLYPPLVRLWSGKPAPVTWQVMSMAPFDHRLTRTGRQTVELEVLGGRMLETVFEQLFRSATLPLPEGARVELDGVEVTVLALDAGLPQKLGIRFHEDPDAGGTTFVGWRDHRLVPLALPAVGESVVLPLLPGVLAF